MSDEKLISSINDNSDDDMASEPPKSRGFSKRHLWGLLCLLVLAGFMLGFILPVVGQFWMSQPGIWLAVAEIMMLLGGFGYLRFKGSSSLDYQFYEKQFESTNDFLKIGMFCLFTTLVTLGPAAQLAVPIPILVLGLLFFIMPLLLDAFCDKRIFPLTEEEKKHVSISEGVTHIKNKELYFWDLLESIKIPPSVTHIGFSAFSGCSSLRSPLVLSSVTHIGKGAFSGCSSLPSIELSASVTHIGDSAFSGCSSLRSIELSASLTDIGEYAFHNCSSLRSIELSASLTDIGENAFRGCSSLKAIFVKSSEETDIKRIVVLLRGGAAFTHCTNLQFIVVDTNNTDEIARIQHSLPPNIKEKVQVLSQHDFFKRIQPIAERGFDDLAKETTVLLKPEIKDAQFFLEMKMPVEILKLIGSYTDNFFNTKHYGKMVNNILQHPFPMVLFDQEQINKCQRQIEALVINSFFRPNPANTDSGAPEVKVGDSQYRLNSPTMLLR